MTAARNGDTVRVHYTGSLGDGTVFDSSKEREPLEFTLGEGKIISGFEQAVVGMEPGESKTVQIESDNAYGPHREEMVVSVERTRLPEDIEPQVGGQLQVRQPDGSVHPVIVTEVSDASVTLDANHPLAGEDLNFEIELEEIV